MTMISITVSFVFDNPSRCIVFSPCLFPTFHSRPSSPIPIPHFLPFLLSPSLQLLSLPLQPFPFLEPALFHPVCPTPPPTPFYKNRPLAFATLTRQTKMYRNRIRLQIHSFKFDTQVTYLWLGDNDLRSNNNNQCRTISQQHRRPSVQTSTASLSSTSLGVERSPGCMPLGLGCVFATIAPQHQQPPGLPMSDIRLDQSYMQWACQQPHTSVEAEQNAGDATLEYPFSSRPRHPLRKQTAEPTGE